MSVFLGSIHYCQMTWATVMLRIIVFAVSLALIFMARIAYSECFGSGEYVVCTESYSDADGNLEVRSWDSEGNSYSVNTESYVSDEGTTVRSYDSEGNEYSVRSWSDSEGIHSEDSAGNRCTITYDGEMIGCD